MKPERLPLERLQAMLDHANQKARAEDCTRRLDNRKLVITLQNATRINILRAWGGDCADL